MLVFERRSATAMLGVVAALACSASAASAGSYHVYSCRAPSGAPAPADGWVGTVAGSASHAEDTCARGGALSAVLGEESGRIANSDSATWQFTPPAGELLVGATLWRAGDADGGETPQTSYLNRLAGPEAGFRFEECNYSAGCHGGFGVETVPLSAGNLVTAGPANLFGSLYATATCAGLPGYVCAEGQGDANHDAAAIYVYAADLTLEQAAGPAVLGAGGELTTAATLTGTATLSLAATDPGAGVYAVLFSVDGQLVQSTVPDENGGRCRSQAGAALAFLYVKPCPASISAQVGLDTTRIANGVHHLQVSLEDAAGNTAPLLERQIDVQNVLPGPPNGTNASAQAALAVRWAANRGARLTSPFGRAQTVTGRLTAPGGAPIAGASIDVLATPAYTGARPAAMAAPRTGRDGRFSLRIPGGVSSRTLQFAYRARVGDAVPVAVRTLTLSVRAGVHLSVSPYLTGVGQSIHFRGRLLGGLVPRAGKQLVLEARSPGGRWIEFDDVRSDVRGRFRAGYRFRFPGPAHYQFRAICEPESDYPFVQGASNVVAVFER